MRPPWEACGQTVRRTEGANSLSVLQWRWLSALIVLMYVFTTAPPPAEHNSGRASSISHTLQSFGVHLAQGQVIGLDLGSEFVKMALVAAGRPMEIILNSASKRKTSHAVCFADTEKRDMGDEGAAAAAKRPHHVFMHSNLFLGRSATDIDSSFSADLAKSDSAAEAARAASAESSSTAEIEGAPTEETHFSPLKLSAEQSLLQEVGYPHAYYPYRLYADTHRHTVAFLAREGMYLSPEMITANFLSYLRKMAAQTANLPSNAAIGAVITVPCRFSQRQRQALRDAAEIAGLRPIALVHHAAAAATQHALDMPLPSSSATSNNSRSSTGPPSSGAAANAQATAGAAKVAAGPSLKLFVDVGSTGVDFSVVRFEPVPVSSPSSDSKTPKEAAAGPLTLSVQMLSCETMYGIGGHNVDIGLAEMMREAFEKRYPAQGDLRQVPRAMKKLLRQAVLSKHVLSANKKTQFSVEGLLTTESGGELDLHELVDRSHVETVLERMQLQVRMKQALEKTLQNAKVDLKDVDQVELLGGGWRVPHVQQELVAMLAGKSPGMHLNGDEAMATGAAFIAANSTVAFRVKKYYLTDITPYEHSLKIIYRRSAASAGEDLQQSHTQAEAKAEAEEDAQQAKDTEKQKEKRDVVEKVVTLYARNTKFGGTATSKTVSVRTGENLIVQLLEDGVVLETVDVKGVPEAVAKQEASAQEMERQQHQQKEGTSDAAGNSTSSKVVEKKLLGDPKVSLVFTVDGTGVLTFDRAYATFDVQVSEEVPASSTSTTTVAPQVDAEKQASTAAEGGSGAEAGDNSSSTKPSEGDAGAEKEEKSKKDETQAAATTTVQRRKQVVETLRGEAVYAPPLPLTEEQKQQLRQQLSDLEAADLQIHLLSEAINRLESFIYATRSALDEESVSQVTQPEDVEKLRQLLQEDEDYLYSKAKEEGLEAVNERQKALEALVVPIRSRAIELNVRPEVVKAMDAGVSAATSRLQRLKELQERIKEWPPEDKIRKAQQVKEDVEKWWKEKKEDQEKLKRWEDPAFTQKDAQKKLRELDAALTGAEKAPKPTTTTTTSTKRPSAAAAARRKRAARDAAAGEDTQKATVVAGETTEKEHQEGENTGEEAAAAAPSQEDAEPAAEMKAVGDASDAATETTFSDKSEQERPQAEETHDEGAPRQQGPSSENRDEL